MKTQILQLVEQSTKEVNPHTFDIEDGVETKQLSQLLVLERTAASRYLNTLVKEGKLVKINSRPVYFFHRQTLEKMFNLPLETNEFRSFFDLEVALGLVEDLKVNVFEELIGWDRSLIQQVEQCKAAISYPPKGLPFLLAGESGVGKSYLAKLVHHYAIIQGILKSDAPFVTLNCAEFANNPELVTANLFGYTKGAFTGAERDKKGVIEKANGGILFLDEAHRLTPEGQEKLFLFMDQGIYHRLGDNEEWRAASVRLIFATTELPGKAFLTTFTRRIPIIVELPSLKDRTDYEKYQMITSFYQSESKEIKREIVLHSNVLDFLMDTSRAGNIGALKNAVRYSCAKAYSEALETDKKLRLEISLKHFPADDMHKYMIDKAENEDHSQFIDHLIPINTNGQLYPDPYTSKYKSDLEKVYEQLLNKYSEFASRQEHHQLYIDRVSLYVNDYIDKLVFYSDLQETRIEFSVIHQFVKQFISLKSDNNFSAGVLSSLSGNTIIAFTHFIFYSSNQRVTIKEENRVLEFIQFLDRTCQKEWLIINELMDGLTQTFNLHFSVMDKCILVLFINGLKNQQVKESIQCLVVAHGFSTASSISNVANRLLGKHIFKSFDMPLQVDTLEIIRRLNDYLDAVDTSRGVIIFVDMGSLVDVQKKLNCLNNSTVAVVNNITTQIAIDAGEKLLKGLSVNQIVEEITLTHKPQYRIFHPRLEKRPKAIITTCVTGIGTAVKIKELLEKSVDGKHIQVVAYDFLCLKNNQEKESVFQDFDVICIVGTANPEIENVSFLPLEDIISGHEEEELMYLLKPHVEEASIQKINNNLIKHFSLQSVLNHLTILNPNQLMEHLSDALELLQNLIGRRFSNATRISMYVHLSCLIERLVTQRPINSYPNLETFNQQQEEFIQVVRQAFESIEKTYSITIPLAEIGYIYDMVKIKVQ
ncbi:hypothetical protein CHH72_19590 [Shouchella clausii]|uniref:PRD domain-containing protein n=1 Tax=Shouchella clausii TaxID=79880 RepID=A0A268NUM3_SHOCL|nr:hypothetical protein CHH72_19590 [Shouchella clausii]